MLGVSTSRDVVVGLTADTRNTTPVVRPSVHVELTTSALLGRTM
jgi:hypothetical protein